MSSDSSRFPDDTVVLVLHCSRAQALDALAALAPRASGLEVVQGDNERVALVYEPAADPGEEQTLMEWLSDALPGEHASVSTWGGEKNVVWYTEGKRIRAETREPRPLLSELGFHQDADVILATTLWSAVLVRRLGGVDLEDLESVLERVVEPGVRSQLVVRGLADAAAVIHPSADVGLVFYGLLDREYGELVGLYWKSDRRFIAEFVGADGEARTFSYPVPEADELEDDPELLADVDGETLPTRIALHLGLSRDLLPEGLP